MTPQRILPTIMIVLSALASLVYAAHGDVRRMIYWASSALIILSVTY